MLSRPPGRFRMMYAGAPVVLARLCQELRVAPLVNAMVKWDERQWRVSPGALTVALILNLLVDRKPLYQIQKFYERRDLDLLFAEPVQIDALNDDALGRTLDRIAAIETEQLIQSVALCAVRVGEMKISSVHADTTSISVQGDFQPTETDNRFYEESGQKPLAINHGHSKQKRPDLKQFTCGLIVSQDGVPLGGTVRNGNWSDQVWNREILGAMEQSFLDPQSIIYVADSALISIHNLRLMAQSKVRFISRLPERFKVAQTVKDRAFATKKWEVVGPRAKTARKNVAAYQLVSFEEQFDGRKYRFVVVRSSAQDRRKERKWERTVSKEEKTLTTTIGSLRKKRFACRVDAEQALQDLLQGNANALHRVTGMVVAYTETKYPPGRPRKDVEYPRDTYFEVHLRLFAPSEKVRKAWMDRETSFILITNLPEDQWSDVAILDEYKSQHKVEQRFRFTKHPIVAEGVFLKSTRRVKAFGYVVILALLVASFLERRVRRALREEKSRLHLRMQERRTQSPTSLALLKELNDITTLQHVTDDGCTRYLNDDLHDSQLDLLRLAGYGPEVFVTTLTSSLSPG